MTRSDKLERAKMSLLELGEYLKNVSKACRVMVGIPSYLMGFEIGAPLTLERNQPQHIVPGHSTS